MEGEKENAGSGGDLAASLVGAALAGPVILPGATPGRMNAAPTAMVARKSSGTRSASGKIKAAAGGNGRVRAGATAGGADGAGAANGPCGARGAEGAAESSLLWALIAAEGETTQVARDAGLRLADARALLGDTAQVQRIRRLRAAGSAIAQGELALMARAVFAELLLNARGGSDLAALIRVFDKLPAGADADGGSDEALLEEISGLSLDEAVAKARQLLSEIDAAEGRGLQHAAEAAQ